MARPAAQNHRKLRFMTDSEYEDEASILLAEYGNRHGLVTEPPIPIDEIVELYLQLKLTFGDMRELFGVDDVLGALWVNKRRVGIDQNLEPNDHPAMLGRYRFTMAHEAGHWRLHRHLFLRKANQLSLLPNGTERPEYICRSSDFDPIEVQANRFASCLLMPREMLKRAWHQWQGSMEPIYLADLKSPVESAGSSAMVAESVERGNFGLSLNPADNYLLELAIRPLAEVFEVSPQALRIRLEGMKLLLRKREPSLFD